MEDTAASDQVQGQLSLYSCVTGDFTEAPRAGDRHGHTGWFVLPMEPVFLFSSPGCVAE